MVMIADSCKPIPPITKGRNEKEVATAWIINIWNILKISISKASATKYHWEPTKNHPIKLIEKHFTSKKLL